MIINKITILLNKKFSKLIILDKRFFNHRKGDSKLLFNLLFENQGY